MKGLFAIMFFSFLAVNCFAQDEPVVNEQEETDDSYLQQLEYFKIHPLDLNTADEDALKEIIFLNDAEIMSLLAYRNSFGKLISIYELQSVPGWEIVKIKKILPYVTINSVPALREDIRNRIRGGRHEWLVRFSSRLGKPEAAYAGGSGALFVRYKYRYKDLLQYGLSADKDAGERGIDFYSFHFFARNTGKISALAIGDFIVNMGQGLIEWQGIAFAKSAEVMAIKRQSQVLKPYSSSGEFYFHRGVGITVQHKSIESTVFFSFRKLSATLQDDGTVSSLLVSGYHRTASEIKYRNDLGEFVAGGNICIRQTNFHAGLNAVSNHYSLPFQKNDDPYNLYDISGKNWRNVSVDYSGTFRNLHFFGEVAADKNFALAAINGLLLSVDPRIDISFVQRKISKKYQSVYGNAFTESTMPTNEAGLYSGITIRLTNQWKMTAYADLYSFPWLKGDGKDFSVQLDYSPSRQLEIYSRMRNQVKSNVSKTNWRTQLNFSIDKSTIIRNRVEMTSRGFLMYCDVLYKPMLKPWSGNLRLLYFEADSYDDRIYAYENDVLYAVSIPAFFNKGYRYYVNLEYKPSKKISLWMKWAQTLSGTDKTKTSEIKFEINYIKE